MKDAADKVTGELFPMPKKRGRPATGKAMTAAERKRAQRAREQAERARGEGKPTYAELLEAFEKFTAEVDTGTDKMLGVICYDREETSKLDEGKSIINGALGAAKYWIERARGKEKAGDK